MDRCLELELSSFLEEQNNRVILLCDPSVSFIKGASLTKWYDGPYKSPITSTTPQDGLFSMVKDTDGPTV